MNRQTDNERLLADVLAAESDDGFRGALLGETLRLARRRRQFRQMRRIGGVTALLIIAALGVRQLGPKQAEKQQMARTPAPTSYQLVVTQPLSLNQIVNTRPLLADRLIASVATAGIVRTSTGGFSEVGDDELLALAAPQIVALVRRGPHQAELVFVSPPSEPMPQQN